LVFRKFDKALKEGRLFFICKIWGSKKLFFLKIVKNSFSLAQHFKG
jgi:hypothetical protein